jgi:hypothetical protein
VSNFINSKLPSVQTVQLKLGQKNRQKPKFNRLMDTIKSSNNARVLRSAKKIQKKSKVADIEIAPKRKGKHLISNQKRKKKEVSQNLISFAISIIKIDISVPFLKPTL